MIPSRFHLTNMFPVQQAQDGLNYYLHADNPPTTEQFKEVLTHVFNSNPAMGGNAGSALSALSTVVWKKRINEVDQDRLYEMGYNYVGLAHGVPVIYGNLLQGSRVSLPSAMAFTDLLLNLDMIGMHMRDTYPSRPWRVASGVPLERFRKEFIDSVAATINQLKMERRFYDISWMINHENKLYVLIKMINHSFNAVRMDIDFSFHGGGFPLWHMDKESKEVYRMACMLYPELQQIVFRKVVNADA